MKKFTTQRCSAPPLFRRLFPCRTADHRLCVRPWTDNTSSAKSRTSSRDPAAALSTSKHPAVETYPPKRRPRRTCEWPVIVQRLDRNEDPPCHSLNLKRTNSYVFHHQPERESPIWLNYRLRPWWEHHRTHYQRLLLRVTHECHSNQQDAVEDGRLRPRCRHLAISTKQRYMTPDWCRHLANWTKRTHRLWFGPIPSIIW